MFFVPGIYIAVMTLAGPCKDVSKFFRANHACKDLLVDCSSGTCSE